jgi:redox-sensitive bicupin YhaK (pirin superfamily)
VDDEGIDRRALLVGLGATTIGAGLVGCRPASRAQEISMNASDVILSEHALGFPWRTLDPFLFCVHHDDAYPRGDGRLAPAASLAGRELGMDFAGRDGWRMYHGTRVPGFPSHPHRGFETVTVVRRGLIDHSDSMGAAARYGQGDVQWLTAGRGIQHAEMFPLLSTTEPNPVELFQIWLNLPARKKMTAPHFTMLWAPTVPRTTLLDDQGRRTEVVTVAGRFENLAPPSPPPDSWASEPESDVAIWTLALDPGARFTLPAARPGLNRALYLFRGAGVRVAGRETAVGKQLVVRSDRAVPLESGAQKTEILVLQGRPIAEPVAQHGPFVMNTRAELAQAYDDFQRTRFGGWPWGEDDHVHGDSPDRFARRPDGTVERPGA